MKKAVLISISLVLLCFSVIFVGCSNGNEYKGDVEFKAQYERTDWAFFSEFNRPASLVRLDSHAQLDAYICSYDSWEHFGWWDMNNQPIRPQYFSILEEYDNNYFETHYLVIVRLLEGSGSIRHSVDYIKSNGVIHISRSIPGVGTCDMAGWSIIIELPNEFNPKSFRVESSNYNPFPYATQVDLAEKYGLSFEGNIWNDYMPSIVPSTSSVHYVQITTQQELNIEMSVEILTSSKRFFRIFIDIYSGAKTPWGAYDFRATNGFTLDDGEDWAMNVTIKIGNEKQTIELTGTVFVTH